MKKKKEEKDNKRDMNFFKLNISMNNPQIILNQEFILKKIFRFRYIKFNK